VSSSSQSIASQCCVKKQGTGIKYPILFPLVLLGNKLHALGFFVLAENRGIFFFVVLSLAIIVL
jgi:hypothetical protein